MPDKPILKLAFAMGGGVSLGAFSGAALTESIKLALLRLLEPDCEYGKVEVDVFSGASAGTLSLAVMLRGLCWRTKEEVKAATQHLFCLYPGLKARWSTVPESLRLDLIAAQVAQDLQKSAWVEMIDIHGLLGADDAARKNALHSAPGLLDSDAVYSIASQLLLPARKGQSVIIDKRLLAPNCLFACTLTNLTPLIADATATLPTSAGSTPGLRDALRSKIHKDMRIFDIWFKELPADQVAASIQAEKQGLALISEIRDVSSLVPPTAQAAQVPLLGEVFSARKAQVVGKVCDLEQMKFPDRWFRVHLPKGGRPVAAPSQDSHPMPGWPLQHEQTWATIAATSIASGAFPAAFTPAVLKRYKQEFGDLWPKALEKADQHPFAYIDGGVFNNFPVREAYRLVSFLDARGDPSTADIQVQHYRRLLFVEPSITAEQVPLNVPLLGEQEISDPSFWNLWSPAASHKRPTFLRLTALLGDVIGLARHQGSAREADGIAVTRDYAAWRNDFRVAMHHLVLNFKAGMDQLVQELYEDLKSATSSMISVLRAEMIPAGEGTVPGELWRVINEEGLTMPRKDADTYLCDGFDEPSIAAHREDWLFAHLCVYFDMLLGLEGKMKETRITAITPYTTADDGLPLDRLDQARADTQLKELKLLGDPFAAFAGFLSPAAREHDYQAGRHCAALFLSYREAAGPPGSLPPLRMVPRADTGWLPAAPARHPREREALRATYQKDLAQNIDLLRARVEQVVTDWQGLATAVLPVFHLRRTLQEAIPGVVEERFSEHGARPPLNRGVEIIILLPKGTAFKLDAPGPLDRDGTAQELYIFGGWYNAIATWAVYDSRDCPLAWKGGAVHHHTHLVIDRPGLHLGHWATVRLPSEAQLMAANNCLRPVAVLHLEHQLTPLLTTTGDWKIEEAAVQLSERLLNYQGRQ